MRSLVFLLEEPSAQDAIEGFIHTIFPSSFAVKFLVFEGKQDLEKRMGRTLRTWQDPSAAFIILRDQDAGDCKAIKSKLTNLCREAGKPHAIVRIACRELESWFLGDWNAVSQAFDLPRLATLNKKSKYRNPDNLANPVEELRNYIPTYQKRDGARRIGPLLTDEANCSSSFTAFISAIRRLV